MNRWMVACLSIIFGLTVHAQKDKYKAVNFAAPIDIPLVLAGNFGELRSNHFHTGIDIKTERRTGLKVRSVEDGYVSRIRVSPWGYGHVVYIDHYNGYTTVYAHLESFEGELGALAYQQQKKAGSFSIDYYPEKDSLKVKRGQVIAKSGNTGGSTAPHLHFEIRETKTEHALNPLLFNFEIADTKKPIIREMKLYGLTKEGYRIPGKAVRRDVRGGNGQYEIANNTLTIPASYVSEDGGIGLAFDVIDQLNAANNICGIHEAYLLVNGDTVFTQNMERIFFESNRYINSHKDYEEYHTRRRHYHKAFKTVHNPLPIYRENIKHGVIPIQPSQHYQVEYIVRDSYLNTSSLRFEIVIGDGESKDYAKTTYAEKTLFPDSAFLSYEQTHYIMFPPGLLYEPTALTLIASENKITFGKDNTPLQESYKIMLPLVDAAYADKAYIQRKNSKGWRYAEGGTVKDGWITTRTRFFGVFSVEIDTIPPIISERNFRNNGLVNGRMLSWYITESESGLKNYQIFIDDEWHLMEYEPKNNLFFFHPPKALKGKKKLIVKAVDRVGNESVKEYTLTF